MHFKLTGNNPDVSHCPFQFSGTLLTRNSIPRPPPQEKEREEGGSRERERERERGVQQVSHKSVGSSVLSD